MRLVYTDLLKDLEGGATVVTPSLLLAAVANEQFNRAQAIQGKGAWERPAVYGIDQWMPACWQEARYSRPDVPTLLSPLQERELWRRMIHADRPDLFDPAAMANLASRSARLVAEYEIPLNETDWQEREDSRQFHSWLLAVRQTCKAQGWMLRSDLWRHLGDWTAGSSRVFAGFSRVSPGLKRLGAVRVAPASVKKADAVEFDSFLEEVEHAARVSRDWVEAGETSIAIFVADLARHASLVRRTFEAAFYPAGREDMCAFHLSTHALENEPLIASALLFLELLKPRIDHAAAGAILRSPFIAGAMEERSARALADVNLRRARELDVTLRDLEYACRECPRMTAVLKAVRAVLPGLPMRQNPSAWARPFSDLLSACGWPGREPNDRQRELMDHWSSALSDLSTLSLVYPDISMDTAIGRLREILSRPVQIGDWSSPVQILDTSSAEGLAFDQGLLVGLSEEGFLRPRALSPLLPFRLQRRHQVPGSSAEGLAELRDAAARALLNAAPTMSATFSKELPPFARPLVKRAAKQTAARKKAFEAVGLEEIADGIAPALAVSASLRGGASVIKAQSQCPFKAFAEYRLNARPPEDACFGYDARDRGGFAHKALELVWKEIGSQQRLKSLGYEELREVVRTSVFAAVKSTPDDGPLHRLASLAEQERLETLILSWLDVEKERQKPFTVEHIEEKRYFEVPGLRLDLRVDRVDRLADGSAVLIDYKTGKQSKVKLEGRRPKEPQLLVYAAALEERVAGLVFGELTPTEPRIVGHTHLKLIKGSGVKDHRDDWDDFLDGARVTVAGLAAEFVAGIAAVRPERGACTYCTVTPLCRINESARADEDED